MDRRAVYGLLIILCCVLISACAGVFNNKHSATLTSPQDANATTGLVIFSVGSLEACDWRNAHAMLGVYRQDDSVLFRSSLAYLSVNSWMQESDFDDHHGHLYVLKLPSDRYYLLPSYASYRYFLNPPKLKFEVSPNQTIYLGEFYMANQCKYGAQMVIRDQEARDFSMLRAQNPAFVDVKITKRLLILPNSE